MKKTYLQRGFTLIELLVVIAIIGILSSVVLASLNTARGKGANANIKENLAGIRAQAEMLYDSNSPNSYSGLCANANVLAAMTSAQNASGATSIDSVLTNAGATTKVSCHVTAANDAWLISSPLKSAEGTANYWCIDNSGASKGEAAAVLASATACL